MGARWVSLNWAGLKQEALLRGSRGAGACLCLRKVGWEAKGGREGGRAGTRGGTGAWAASLQVRSEETGQQGAA